MALKNEESCIRRAAKAWDETMACATALRVQLSSLSCTISWYLSDPIRAAGWPRDLPKKFIATWARVCQTWHIMSTGETEESKPLFWMGSSLNDLREFPEEVCQSMGFALWQAQLGRKHRDAKVLKGFGGAGVHEMVEDHDGNTYRAVYTVKFAGAVYVLHAFQKKSKKGIKTPMAEINVIRQRLKAAEEHYEKRRAEEEKQRSREH